MKQISILPFAFFYRLFLSPFPRPPLTLTCLKAAGPQNLVDPGGAGLKKCFKCIFTPCLYKLLLRRDLLRYSLFVFSSFFCHFFCFSFCALH